MDVDMEVNSKALGRDCIRGAHHRGQLGETEMCRVPGLLSGRLGTTDGGVEVGAVVYISQLARGGCSMLNHSSGGPSIG